MPDNQVEEVKSKIDIVALLGEHVKLTKSGSNFKGLCPFHEEKTPSFMVSEELQIYKCFGCGEAGDCFTFLEKYEGMEFPEALQYLAEKAGIKLKSFTREDNSKGMLYEINSLAAKFYNYLLVSHPIGKIALNYLKEERKINEDSIKTFNIGFAPANKNALSDFLTKKKNFKLKDLETAGLVYLGRGRPYDRFEGRIIFPISDQRGNVVALAGRLIPPGKPNVGKYINSPETPVYHKSSSLYGLYSTKEYIKKAGFAIVVEGEIDLISSYQAGIKNIVAIKGSAFTPDQARLLGRYTKEVVLALDTDFAGVAASIRGIKILEDAGFEIRVAKLGRFKDPDEAARGDAEFYKEKIKDAVIVWDFIIDSIVAKFDKGSASGKSKISKELTPVLAGINNKIVQEHYINKLAKLLEVSEEAVVEEVQKIDLPEKKEEKVSEKPNLAPKPIEETREEELLVLILKIKPELLKDGRLKGLIQTSFAKRILEEFNKFANINKEFDLKSFIDYLPKELSEKFSVYFLSLDDSDTKIKKEINDLYKLLSMSLARKNYTKETDKKASEKFQKEYRDFDSEQFERII